MLPAQFHASHFLVCLANPASLLPRVPICALKFPLILSCLAIGQSALYSTNQKVHRKARSNSNKSSQCTKRLSHSKRDAWSPNLTTLPSTSMPTPPLPTHTHNLVSTKTNTCRGGGAQWGRISLCRPSPTLNAGPCFSHLSVRIIGVQSPHSYHRIWPYCPCLLKETEMYSFNTEMHIINTDIITHTCISFFPKLLF